jgi:cyanophycinase
LNSIRVIVWFLITLAIATSALSDEQSPVPSGKPAPNLSGPACGPKNGILFLCSRETKDIRERFITLAGGADARFVVVLNRLNLADNSIQHELQALLEKFSGEHGSNNLANDPSAASAKTDKLAAIPSNHESELRAIATEISTNWGVSHLTVWYADDTAGAANKSFLAALRTADGVWFPGGPPDLYADRYVGSPAEQELQLLLDRGGVIGGESGGAAIQASHVRSVKEIKSLTDAPHRIAFFQGFAFLRNMTIFPHFGAKLGLEACQKVVDENSGLVGLGIDNDAAVIVQNGHLEIFGKGEAAVLVNDQSVRKLIAGTRISLASLSDSAPVEATTKASTVDNK